MCCVSFFFFHAHTIHVDRHRFIFTAETHTFKKKMKVFFLFRQGVMQKNIALEHRDAHTRSFSLVLRQFHTFWFHLDVTLTSYFLLATSCAFLFSTTSISFTVVLSNQKKLIKAKINPSLLTKFQGAYFFVSNEYIYSYMAFKLRAFSLLVKSFFFSV